VSRSRPDRAQHRHFTSALVEPGQQRRHHATQANERDERGDAEEGLLPNADRIPQLLQHDAREDGEERLFAVVVDEALDVKDRGAGVEPDEECREAPWCEVLPPGLVG
jgi:hypothetical protein